MKKFASALFFSAAVIGTSFADELPQAPNDILTETATTCTEWAVEDGIAADQQADYVLKCVNDELTNLGYQHVTKL